MQISDLVIAYTFFVNHSNKARAGRKLVIISSNLTIRNVSHNTVIQLQHYTNVCYA